MSTACKDDPDDVPPPTPPIIDEPVKDPAPINKFMDQEMKDRYLWNEEYSKVTGLDFDMDYNDFLSTALQGVTAQNNANAEDGYYDARNEWVYYTYISRYRDTKASGTRADNTQKFGLGITGVAAGNVNGNIYLCVLGSVPGSPAEKKGISRGTYISKVDGTTITADNVVELRKKLYATTPTPVKLELNTITKDENTQMYVVKKLGSVTCEPTNYSNTPILFSAVAGSKTDANVGIAYIVYNAFEMAYDQNLIDTFVQLKELATTNGLPINDLILDLRYNGGGYLFSSALMATLIVGSDYKDQLYCRTTFNDTRNATTSPGEYYIGKKEVPEGAYPLLEEALKASFNLKRVYVLTMNGTASASELIINGLRGMDVEVRTIGETTNGKNVGMEISDMTHEGYVYEFAPVSLRLENAKGFHDYPNGFEPDVLVTNPDNDWLIGAYGSTADPLFGFAYQWITEGKKPSVDKDETRAAGMEFYSIGEPYMEKPQVFGTLVPARTE